MANLRKDEVLCWVHYFYQKGLIINYEMQKQEARTIFYRKRQNHSQNFGQILIGLKRESLIYSSEDKILLFKQDKLNKMLNNKAVLKEPINIREEDYLRTAYLNDMTKLKIRTNKIKIEVTKGAGGGRELLILNAGGKLITNIYITNLTRSSYCLTNIIGLHKNINTVAIDMKNLPIKLTPYGQIMLSIRSNVKKPIMMLMVHVFVFVDLSNNARIDLIKEITVHASGITFKEDSNSINVKTLVTKNNINPKISIKAELSNPYQEYAVGLEKYDIPEPLANLLANGLKLYDGITRQERKQLNDIRSLIPENTLPEHTLNKNNYWRLLDTFVHMEDYQMSVDIRKFDTVTNNLVKVAGYSNRFRLQVPGLSERRPSLLYGDSVYVNAIGDEDTYQGVVRYVDQDSVVLEFNGIFSRDIYVPGMSLSIRYGYNRSNIRIEHRSIDLLSQHGVVSPFFPTKIATSSLKNYDLKWFNPKIETNFQQQQAIRHILSMSSYPSPYLVFGPPGTGKTMTLVEAISQIWKMKPRDNILVCAPSNSVANEIALRLTEYIPKTELFRYMSHSYGMYDIPDAVFPFTNYDNSDFYQPTLEEACSYRIVISTLSNSSRLVSLSTPVKHFNYVFIDESGHATETETLVPIAGLLTCETHYGSLLGQIVLAGDPQQLGPIIHSPHAKVHGFGISMLERLMARDVYKKDSSGKYNPMALTKLILNYRSHPDILYLPNRLFYESELVPKATGIINIALNWEELPNKKMPIIFHNVIGTDQREQNSPSYFNPQEIEMVIHYLNKLIGQNLNGRQIYQEDIGVIAPYRKQVQKLRRACADKMWDKLTIGSVEQFQGQERLIIIVSTVRSQPNLLESDNKFHLGFLNNPKRFNVSITRAKALVILIGNPNLLQHETYWRSFIQYCIDNKCITGQPFLFSSQATDLIALNMAKLRINDEADDSMDFSRGNI